MSFNFPVFSPPNPNNGPINIDLTTLEWIIYGWLSLCFGFSWGQETSSDLIPTIAQAKEQQHCNLKKFVVYANFLASLLDTHHLARLWNLEKS